MVYKCSPRYKRGTPVLVLVTVWNSSLYTCTLHVVTYSSYSGTYAVLSKRVALFLCRNACSFAEGLHVLHRIELFVNRYGVGRMKLK